ncbi:glycosyltransferase family 4 protein [Paraburkholderia domus]|uniref:glycosyltransferase family 4 protein n=1 Tax=Paraburkholderia domus TaxID=2793075 RepID=UPI001B8CF2B5|nr:glycosyltransferase family 4 protein [Paraburkholderia domus]
MDSSIKERIHRFPFFKDTVPKLAYITFLHNAWQMLPALAERKIPFILQLYPGGGFEPNVETSDEKLMAIAHSPLCRKIIVTQNLSRDYLLDKIKCDPAKIELIYGGVYDTRNDFDFSRDKQRFGMHKDTVDICFVAHRYGNDTKKKGYDQFVAVAQALSERYEQVRFHVVGDYTPDQIPLGAAARTIIFHGKQPNTFFREFYARMDMILSVNRPTEAGKGAFDGFPTGACMEAGFRGVLNCISDPLELNVAFTDDVDFVLVDVDTQKTIRRLSALIENTERLYEIAYANWKKFLEVFDTDHQLWRRTRVITAELLRTESLIVRPAPNRSMMDAEFGDNGLRHRVEEASRNFRNLLDEYNKVATAYEALRADYSQVTDYYEKLHGDLLGEYKTLATGYGDLKTEYDRVTEYYEKQQEGLLGEYRTLAGGFESLQRENVSLRENVGGLNENLLRMKDDLDLLESKRHEAASGRLEKGILRMLRSKYSMSIRTGYSWLTSSNRQQLIVQNQEQS